MRLRPLHMLSLMWLLALCGLVSCVDPEPPDFGPDQGVSMEMGAGGCQLTDPCGGGDQDCDGRPDEGPPVEALSPRMVTEQVTSPEVLDMVIDPGGEGWAIWLGEALIDNKVRLYLGQLSENAATPFSLTEEADPDPDRARMALLMGGPLITWRARGPEGSSIWLAHAPEGLAVFKEDLFDGGASLGPPSLAVKEGDGAPFAGVAFVGGSDGDAPEVQLAFWESFLDGILTLPITENMVMEANPEVGVGESALRITWIEPVAEEPDRSDVRMFWESGGADNAPFSPLRGRPGVDRFVHAQRGSALAAVMLQDGGSGLLRLVMETWQVNEDQVLISDNRPLVLSADGVPAREPVIVAGEDAWFVAWVEMREAGVDQPVVLARVPFDRSVPLTRTVITPRPTVAVKPALATHEGQVNAAWLEVVEGAGRWRLMLQEQVEGLSCR